MSTTEIRSTSLASNDGDSGFTIHFLANAEYAHDAGYNATLTLTGRHWDGEVHASTVRIENVWLRSDDLVELRDSLEQWTNLSLERLRTQPLKGAFELARLPAQSVMLRFGARDDTISGLNPVVSLGLSAGPLKCEYHYVTDQTCLAAFALGIPKQ